MANNLFDAVKEVDNATITTNGMAAWKSTLSNVLDLFAMGSSYRKNPGAIRKIVRDAYLEDKLSTIRCLFYLRDIRGNGGQGEREVFRNGIREVAELDTKTFINSNIISHIPTFGRWDDLFSLFDISAELDSQIINFINEQLKEDIKAYLNNKSSEKKMPVSIMAKWLPSCNTSSKKTRRLAKKLYTTLGLSESRYRKMLSNLRKQIGILETYLTNKDYTFDYSAVPSNANMKYRKCFYEKDGERYKAHVEAVTKVLDSNEPITRGMPKDNVKTLYPYEIVSNFYNTDGWRINDASISNIEKQRYENMWKQLPNYFGEASNKNWIAVIDTSGSMFMSKKPTPIDVAISLGIYIGERNTGIFKDKYITFSSRPSFVEVNGSWSLEKKVKHIISKSIVDDTNLIGVYELILKAAKSHNLPVKEMPEAIVMISDMQFNSCVEDGQNDTAYRKINKMYSSAGYPVPKLIFWNVAQNDYGNLPVTQHEKGAILVGGCKPGMFEQILSGKTPADFMMTILNGERYGVITISE